jgi:hypothetical protein
MESVWGGGKKRGEIKDESMEDERWGKKEGVATPGTSKYAKRTTR